MILFSISCEFSCQNTITIIVSNPNGISTNIGTGIDIKTLRSLRVTTLKRKDTIDVSVNSFRKIYIRNEFSFETIVAQRGDTVITNISKDGLVFNFLNKKFKKYDTLNLSDFLNVRLKYEDSLIKSMDRDLLGNEGAFRRGQLIRNRKYELGDYLNSLSLKEEFNKKILDLLDQKFKKGLLSRANYEFHASEIKYKLFNDLISVYHLTNENLFKDEILIKFFKDDMVINDDFIGYGYINRFIQDIVLEGISLQSFPKIRYNYKTAFDVLPSFVSGNLLKYSQLLCLAEILKYEDINVFKAYSQRFVYLFGNENLGIISGSKIEYLKTFSGIKEYYKELYFNDLQGNHLSFTEILEKNMGKLIYIDFWASWCRPCRSLMPESKNLQNKFKNKNVSFIYLSIDKDMNEWEKAASDEGIWRNKNNYRAINYPNSNFYKELAISTIPRFILLDDGGEILLHNAPSPDSGLAELLIEKYLKRIKK
ncbi:TlpA family protein disulfide reductase [Algibacter mikhailovii]|uniref:TlpA family protein disulfide reductase n=1 Tax=Algibacter mikhailovii TaxID=425498 RepID=UPI00249505BC|nr:TlpA disulfide reductase family protein [Algibacter mikhailovii]